MSKNAKATKTVNPLHFEDLEPHRFEDLVRRLLYGFKEWSNIEATGRSGSDEGFDVRAWEKGSVVTNEGEEGEEGIHEIDGQLWQVQGKREKSITPGKMRTIIRDGIDSSNPPYGYILAAATNISKSAYDAFRAELRKKGVIEFYFWGKDYLEDQLSLPQNDEILFTFFGLSLSPRRRSRTTEIKFGINNKNKLLKLIFGNEKLYSQQAVPRKTFLLRDVKDEHYPYESQYKDFEKHRRWEEHDVADVTPRGLFFKLREWYAYFDRAKKEWDFTREIDLSPRKHNIDQANRDRLEDKGKNVEHYWRHLPRRAQSKLRVFGFVSFDDILIIDEKGDPKFDDPHLFIDFGSEGPFQYTIADLVNDREAVANFENFKRIQSFPKKFPNPPNGNVVDLAQLKLNDEGLTTLRNLRGAATVYAFESGAHRLAENDLIRIPKDDSDRNSSEKHAEVTRVFDATVDEVLAIDGSHYRSYLEHIAGKKLKGSEPVTAYEVHQVWMLNGKSLYTGDERGW